MLHSLLLASCILSLTKAGDEYLLDFPDPMQPSFNNIIGYIPIEDEMHFELVRQPILCPNCHLYLFLILFMLHYSLF